LEEELEKLLLDGQPSKQPKVSAMAAFKQELKDKIGLMMQDHS